MKYSIVILINIFVSTCGKECIFSFFDSLERHIIACHTTDFQCFKRQYQALRDNVLLGSRQLSIGLYQPYVFQYGDTGTCVKLGGVEQSELVAISMNSITEEYKMVFEMPMLVQQIWNTSLACSTPNISFGVLGLHEGTLKKFSGNATVSVSYPYTHQIRNGSVYMLLEEEDLDILLDMPDHSEHDRENETEVKLYEVSEWAYDMVQQVDVAEHSIMPYTGQLRKVTELLPLEKFLLLYPEEEYSKMKFSLTINKCS